MMFVCGVWSNNVYFEEDWQICEQNILISFSCFSANCQREADIIFLLDASVSMVDYFDEVKQSVVKLMYT